ncbi:DUF1467 family protein [Acuticoccus mangrovi]|uniref:DUF1467 family protein n=1 Tax=Acuticoccus mangrovi TaxID=2796142 RepID=A0A934ISM3_9HYPH|nr:DUF1467 family protein [Acuticoccus mangrovi]MBJ3777457.1 DUF1467 family protein [Acuticoccus mangrovi]
MGLGSGIAIYFIIWWLLLFLVLPFGDRRPDPAHERVSGAEPGAPALPRMWRKVIITSLLSFVVFGGVYWVLTSGLTLEDVPLPSADGVVAHPKGEIPK